MNKIFSIMINDDDNELIKAVDILRDYGIDVVFITRSHIVDEFGKITKEIKVIHCQTTTSRYEIFEQSNNLFGILL